MVANFPRRVFYRGVTFPEGGLFLGGTLPGGSFPRGDFSVRGFL